MGKKRRNNNAFQNGGDDDDQFNLDKFDDRPTATDGIKNNFTSNNNNINGGGGGGGGGMSRAAKKRAKKRAKTSSVATAAATVTDVSNGSKIASSNGDVSMKKKSSESNKLQKMQLPLDSDDSDNNTDDGEIMVKSKAAVAKESHVDDIKVTKKKKKKKDKKARKDKVVDDDDEKDVDMAHHIAGVAEDDDDDEMEQVEELLSTLTPLQILLLDGDKATDASEESNIVDDEALLAKINEDAKQPALSDFESDFEMAQQKSELEDVVGVFDPEDGAAAERAATERMIDPKHLIGDITTELRARVLLSSLLSPSGVTVNEFYQEYWGKRPLLAALDDINEIHGDDDDDDDDEQQQQPQMSKEAIQEAANHTTRLDGFLNRTVIDEMIRKNKLRYGLDLNVTRYTDTMGNGLRHRITLDPPPKKKKRNKSDDNVVDNEELEYIVANPNDVWSNVDTSQCTVRLLRPHEHNDNIHTMLSLLESEFGCMVGSNAYLTPLNSQGFAPHYDDVDVFILQLEGYKRWRVYAPFNKRETLPRESSRDYTEKEVDENIGEGQEMDVVLGPGDVLYLPRGWIHQAETVARPAHLPKNNGMKDDHSLHLTVSAMQNWCWADFLEILMPEALESAVTSDKSTSLREGLPKNFVNYMGTMHQLDDDEGGPMGLKEASAAIKKLQDGSGGGSEEEDDVDEEALMEFKSQQKIRAQQQHFKDEAKKRIMRVCKQAMSMLDDACDQIGKRFLSDRLPPALLEPERSLTKEAFANNAANYHEAAKKIWPNTLCRLARPGIARLVIEDEQAILYHCNDNSRVYHGTPLSPMEFEIDDAPALEQLLTTVEPHWIMVKDLIHGDIEDKMEIAQSLYDEGILATMLTESPDRSVQTG
jgi:lysine-specific demethylase/histidyl-hydroxylase NO66